MGSNGNRRCTPVILNNTVVNNSSATLHFNCRVAFPGTRSGLTSTGKWNNSNAEQQKSGSAVRNSFELIVINLVSEVGQPSWAASLVSQVDLSGSSVKKDSQAGHPSRPVNFVCQVGQSSRGRQVGQSCW